MQKGPAVLHPVLERHSILNVASASRAFEAILAIFNTSCLLLSSSYPLVQTAASMISLCNPPQAPQHSLLTCSRSLSLPRLQCTAKASIGPSAHTSLRDHLPSRSLLLTSPLNKMIRRYIGKNIHSFTQIIALNITLTMLIAWVITSPVVAKRKIVTIIYIALLTNMNIPNSSDR